MMFNAVPRVSRQSLALAALGVLALPGHDARGDEFIVLAGESIQAVIDDPATMDGDIITVSAGTYIELIDFRGKAITLRSADGPDVTTIDGAGAGSVVMCSTGEGADTVLEGFTITGGDAFQGGGMWNLLASPTVRGCTFIDNNAIFDGGGVYNDSGTPMYIDCKFVANTAFFGAGMANILAQPIVINGLFVGNVASPQNGGNGGGVDNFSDSDGLLLNCTFSSNVAGVGGGISSSNSSPVIANCIVSGNTAGGDPEISTFGTKLPVFIHSLVGGSGGSDNWDDALGTDVGDNIDTDPMFTDPLGEDGFVGTLDDDLRLLAGSPAIDAGLATIVPNEITTDLAGAPRLVDDPDTPDSGPGLLVLDIGAYEYQVPEGGPSGDLAQFGLDIRPRRCPNVLRPYGYLWAAVKGTDEYDAAEIDPETIVIRRQDGVGDSVVPSRVLSKMRDLRGTSSCDCDKSEPDGHSDLVMRFRARDVFSALQLGDVERNQDVEIVVEGLLMDGTPFTSVDCAKIGRIRSCWWRGHHWRR